jgi:hypothetical protein
LISAPASLDVAVVVEVLREAGADVLTTADVAPGTELRDALQPADSVIIVLPNNPELDPPALYVEVGIALGRDVPIFVVVEAPRRVPLALGTIAHVTSPLDDRDALELHLGLFLASIESRHREGSPPREITPSSQIDVRDVRSRVEELHRLTGRARRKALEDLTMWLFETAGATVERRGRDASDTGVDVVAVFPGEESRLGPLFIQVKATRAPRHREEIKAALQAAVIRNNGGLGVLLYERGPLDRRQSTPLIVELTLDDLINELERRDLAEVLRRERNRAIHRM